MTENRRFFSEYVDSPTQTGNTTMMFIPFEIKTASLTAGLEIKEEPSILSACSPLFVATAVQKTVKVYKGDTFECTFCFNTETNVSCIALSEESVLLLVAENSGKISLYHNPSEKQVWSHVCQCPEFNSIQINQAFLTIDASGFLKIFLFTKENVLFQFSNISVSSLISGDETDNLDALENIHIEHLNLPQCSELEKPKLFQLHNDVFSVGLMAQCSPVALEEKEFFDVEDLLNGELENECQDEWKSDVNSPIRFMEFTENAVTKTICTRDGRHIICLNDKNELQVMSSITNLIMMSWKRPENKGRAIDFVLSETVDSGSLQVSETKIAVLVDQRSSERKSSSFVLEIRKFPSLELIHSLDLDDYVQLMDSKPNQDFWCFLNGEITVDSSGRRLLNNLVMKGVFESRPEARLMNLVSRRKFNEAEKLAEESNLSPEVIHQTKIKCILNSMSRNKYPDSTKEQVDNLWKELEESFSYVNDKQFVSSIVMHPLPNIVSTRRLLFCIKGWAKKNKDTIGTSIISQVNQLLNKISSYEILSSDTDSFMTLKEFTNKDLLMLLLNELKVGNSISAFELWQRHKDEILSSNQESIQQIIAAIPNSTPSSYLISFLKDFLPVAFSKIPDFIDEAALWLIRRIHMVELDEKHLWPENGLELATVFLKILKDSHFKDSRGELDFSTSLAITAMHKKTIGFDLAIGTIVKQAKNLKWLLTLKKNFNCRIVLSECQDSTMEMIFAVLDRVDIALIPKVIEEFICPYALDNDLDLEFCLEEYIKHTLQNTCFSWWSWDEDPWEERLITVINTIRSTDRWITTALLVINRAAVPWSEKIQSLVNKGMASDCKRKKEFIMHSKLVGYKEVLLKYNLRNFPITKEVNQVDAFVNYIFKQNRSTALDDAKKVFTAVCDDELGRDVHYKYLLFQLNQNKLDEAIEIISTFPQDIAVYCAKRCFRYIKLMLDDSVLLKQEEERSKKLLYFGLYLSEFLQKANELVDADEVVCLRSLSKLQEEFGISITYSDIRCKSKDIIESANDDFLAKGTSLTKTSHTSDKKRESVSSSISRLNRLGDILLLEREEVMGLLITKCLKKRKYELLFQLCKELSSSYSNTDTTETLLKVVEHFYLNFKSITAMSFSAIVDAMFHLTKNAVTYCKEEMISKCMDIVQLSTYLTSIKDLCGQQSLFVQAELASDSYHRWKFYPIYRDEGFQMDCEVITNFIMLLAEDIIKKPDAEGTVCLYNNLFDVTKNVFEQMSEIGQGLTALRTFFYYYYNKVKILSECYEIPESDAMKHLSDLQLQNPTARVIFSVLQRIVSQRRVDFYYGCQLFSILPESTLTFSLKELVKWSASDLNRLSAVGKMAMEVSNSRGRINEFHIYENIYKKASLLSKKNIKTVPIEVILNDSNQEQNQTVVEDLISQKKVDIPTLNECCDAFQLETDDVLIAYLTNILTEAEKKILQCADHDVDIEPELREANKVIRSIENEELIFNRFTHLEEQVSPYSYEILHFIEDQLLSISANIRTISSSTYEKNMKLLEFLKVYRRISSVDEREMEKWQCLDNAEPKLHAIAEKRLPFHVFSREDPHTIINPELNASTLDVWLQLSSILKVQSDHLILMAVKNNVTKYLAENPSSSVMLHADTRFFNTISEMIEKIVGDENKVAAATWATNKLPAGGNKVEFSALTARLSREWYAVSAVEPVMQIYKRILNIWRQSTMEKTLYKNNLNTNTSLSLIHQPPQLIEHLLEDYTLNIEQCLKVCKSILEIGEVISKDYDSTFLRFIFKWSDVSRSSDSNFDETFSEEPFSAKNAVECEDGDDIDRQNIFRVMNLLLCLPESILKNLLQVIKKNFTSIPVHQRTRLLICLVSVLGAETVSAILDLDKDVLETFLVPLICGIELQNLNLPFSHPVFMKCDKAELVHKVLTTQFKNPRALIFAVRLCVEFGVWDTNIWEVILKRMALRPVECHLHDILLAHQGRLSHLWHTETFVEAWKSVLREILKADFDHSSLMSKLYKALLNCPCAPVMDIYFLKSDLKFILQQHDATIARDLEKVTQISELVLVLKTVIKG